jgi:hypothetical protein
MKLCPLKAQKWKKGKRPRKESKPPGSRCTSSRRVVVVNHDTEEAENPATEWEGKKKKKKKKKKEERNRCQGISNFSHSIGRPHPVATLW